MKTELDKEVLEQFKEDCDLFLELMKDKVIKQTARGEENLPRLRYTVKGNYLYVENYQTFLNYCNRSAPHLIKFFNTKLSCLVELLDSVIRIRGNIKLDLIRQIEKQFYLKEVLCPFCTSPETKRLSSTEITCLNCNQSRNFSL